MRWTWITFVCATACAPEEHRRPDPSTFDDPLAGEALQDVRQKRSRKAVRPGDLARGDDPVAPLQGQVREGDEGVIDPAGEFEHDALFYDAAPL